VRIPKRLKCPAAGAAAGATLAVACATSAVPDRAPPAAPIAPPPHFVADSQLWMDMRNVDLHIDDRHVMHVRSLHGRVVPKVDGTIATLDDPRSFVVHTTAGLVALDGDAITTLLHNTALADPRVPIKGLQVRIEDGMLVQKGILHKGVDIPFEMKSIPRLEPDGRIRLHPDKLRIFTVDGNKLMHALGLHLEKMMDLTHAVAMSVHGDDIYLDPLAIIPPPAIAGRLSDVRIEGTQLVQEFARTANDSIFGSFVKPDSGSRNFIYFRGGMLRFGRLTMTDTDLLIHDADESDPFDLYFAKYNAQLVAGRTRNLPNYGLRTWMVDYAKVIDATKAVAAR
jgi:hypothetical protein